MPADDFAVVDLWLACRARGAGAMPTTGGVGDQPAALMDTFRILEVLAQEA